jgi:hypothetical protein
MYEYTSSRIVFKYILNMKNNRLALSENATNLLRGMLERKVPNRLACGPGGTAEMKASPFFKPLGTLCLYIHISLHILSLTNNLDK